MNCKNIEIYLDALMDNELSVEKSLEIIDHIDSCKDCKTKWELSEGIKSKLIHYTNSQRPPSELTSLIYKKYEVNRTPRYLKQTLLAASIAFLIGLGLFAGSLYMRVPALSELHEKTKLQLVTNDVGVLSDKFQLNLNKQKLVKFENASFHVQGATQIAKPFNKKLSLIALKNDKGQKVSICFLPGNYEVPGCHKMEMNGLTVFCGGKKNCHYAYWRQGGQTIALVGDGITSEEMIQLAMPIIQEV